MTLVYVLVGVTAQFLLGLGLAYLLTQGLPGQRFFRVVFLLPMTITPVGVAYMFRMLTDTGKGPLQPLWAAVGLSDFSWVNNPWGARVAV
ncbi:MAG: carbohydrate ABC transporter permease, partial [Actinomycetota bacterium]